jgi:hypothetical protein
VQDDRASVVSAEEWANCVAMEKVNAVVENGNERQTVKFVFKDRSVVFFSFNPRLPSLSLSLSLSHIPLTLID